MQIILMQIRDACKTDIDDTDGDRTDLKRQIQKIQLEIRQMKVRQIHMVQMDIGYGVNTNTDNTDAGKTGKKVNTGYRIYRIQVIQD